MKVNDILTEISKKKYKKKELDIGKVADYLKKNCSQFLSNNIDTPLYRGTWSEYETGAVKIDTTSGTRRSENTWNHYTLLLDNSPYYQGWPKRSKSIICTTDPREASSYGTVMALIPVDGAKIGIVPESDMWHAHFDFSAMFNRKDTMDFETLPWTMTRLGFPDTTYASLVKHASTPKFIKKFAEEFPDATIRPEEFLPYLLEQMAPANVGMEMRTTADFITTDFKKRECWVEGKCVLIEYEHYNQIKASLR